MVLREQGVKERTWGKEGPKGRVSARGNAPGSELMVPSSSGGRFSEATQVF